MAHSWRPQISILDLKNLPRPFLCMALTRWRSGVLLVNDEELDHDAKHGQRLDLRLEGVKDIADPDKLVLSVCVHMPVLPVVAAGFARPGRGSSVAAVLRG